MKRFELLGMMSDYLEALIANRPDEVPLALNAKVTFNGEECPLGENEIWRRARVFPQRQTFVDLKSDTVVFFGAVTNELRGTGIQKNLDFLNGFYKLFVVRLHILEKMIDEVEEVCIDNKIASFSADLKDVHLPILLFEMPVPEDERVSRTELIRIVESYWEAVARTGSISDMPVHPDVCRYENGSRTTDEARTFLQDFSVDTFRWDTPRRERFYHVVDESRQLVVSSQVFYREPYSSRLPSDSKGFYVYEVFKIGSGRLQMIYAFWRTYQIKSGWSK